ncbi:glycosyltransferase [Endozoicomonas elysicola]|uniref:Glycosyltransferase subfamily 4-like N-terminal domain-containing protein n=1 Tax=Endozoicomonas elysicola TaxID=305900 RepID=A0A081K9C9_9GAMM|nr:glycosyltransferase [Endozoicomonas elysicola]KEI70755.1 hypothetical protein GV64_08370 [Endozoicomonas elysicola]
MNVLYLLATLNIKTGTPKKILDLVGESSANSTVFTWTLGSSENAKLYRANGADVVQIDGGRNVFLVIYKLKRLIDAKNIDVVVCHYSYGEFIGSILKVLCQNIKIVVPFVGPFAPSRLKRIVLESFSYKKLDAVIYVSEYIKKEKLIQFPMLKNVESRVIYNGTDLPLEKYKIKSENFLTMSTTGSLIDWKNIDFLLPIIKDLKSKHHLDTRLYILGAGPMKSILQDKIAMLGLGNDVVLVGATDNVGGYLNASDIYLHPSLKEGFGVAVIEGMYCENCVITSDKGALPELTNNVSSFSIACDSTLWVDKIVELCGSDKLEVLKQHSKTYVESKFSTKLFSSKYDTFLDSLIK